MHLAVVPRYNCGMSRRVHSCMNEAICGVVGLWGCGEARFDLT